MDPAHKLPNLLHATVGKFLNTKSKQLIGYDGGKLYIHDITNPNKPVVIKNFCDKVDTEGTSPISSEILNLSYIPNKGKRRDSLLVTVCMNYDHWCKLILFQVNISTQYELQNIIKIRVKDCDIRELNKELYYAPCTIKGKHYGCITTTAPVSYAGTEAYACDVAIVSHMGVATSQLLDTRICEFMDNPQFFWVSPTVMAFCGYVNLVEEQGNGISFFKVDKPKYDAMDLGMNPINLDGTSGYEWSLWAHSISKDEIPMKVLQAGPTNKRNLAMVVYEHPNGNIVIRAIQHGSEVGFFHKEIIVSNAKFCNMLKPNQNEVCLLFDKEYYMYASETSFTRYSYPDFGYRQYPLELKHLGNNTYTFRKDNMTMGIYELNIENDVVTFEDTQCDIESPIKMPIIPPSYYYPQQPYGDFSLGL